MAEDNDILGMITSLEAKRAALDNAIAALRQLAGGEMVVEGSVPPMGQEGAMRSDAFHGLSMPEAVKRYLRMTKVPQNAKNIAEVLPRGGFKSKAKNLYPNVYTALLRLQEAGEVEKLASGEWGLSDWYRGGTAKKDRKAKEAENADGTKAAATGPSQTAVSSAP